MKKLKIFLTAFLLLFALAFTGCQGKDAAPTIDDKEIFEEDLMPLTEDELAKLDDTSAIDEEMTLLDESELNNLEETFEDEDAPEQKNEDEIDREAGGLTVEENGTYTAKEEVAVYIHAFEKLPSNYITKKEAESLGWDSTRGNLDEVAPGKSIGGDKFGNYDKMLPIEKDRKYFECDIDFDGGYRNAKRIVYSNDGLIFYTEDHYKTFEQLY